MRDKDEAKPSRVNAAIALKTAEYNMTCTYGNLSHMYPIMIWPRVRESEGWDTQNGDEIESR